MVKCSRAKCHHTLISVHVYENTFFPGVLVKLFMYYYVFHTFVHSFESYINSKSYINVFVKDKELI